MRHIFTVSLLVWMLAIVSVGLAQDGEAAYSVERYALANYPVSLVFAPDGRLFYTEKATGNVRVINADGHTQPDPVINLPSDSLVERGLLGITLDPNYAENGMIWTVHTAPGTSRDWPANQVVRFHEENGVGSDPEVMFSVPITNGELKHNGGGIHFDADGLLYVSFGDYGDAANAQDLSVIPGKIHRFEVTEDGLVPAPDNPFPDSSIYAYGLRNTFAFTFDPFGDALFGSENGFKCDDEINLILPGKNYGWGPDYGEQCFGTEMLDLPDYMPPMLSLSPTVGMTGITVYAGTMFPDWEGQIFFCEWNSGTMQRVLLDESRTAVETMEQVDLGEYFCRIDVTVGTDGALYFTDPGGIYRISSGT